MKKTERNDDALTPRVVFLLLIVATLYLSTITAIFVLDQQDVKITPTAVITLEELGGKGPWLNFSHKSGDTLLLNDIKLIVLNKNNKQQIIIESISEDELESLEAGDTLSVMINGDNTLIQMNHQTIGNPVISEGTLSGWSEGDEIEVSFIYEPSGGLITSNSQVSTTDITPVEAPAITVTANPTTINIPVPKLAVTPDPTPTPIPMPIPTPTPVPIGPYIQYTEGNAMANGKSDGNVVLTVSTSPEAVNDFDVSHIQVSWTGVEDVGTLEKIEIKRGANCNIELPESSPGKAGGDVDCILKPDSDYKIFLRGFLDSEGEMADMSGASITVTLTMTYGGQPPEQVSVTLTVPE